MRLTILGCGTSSGVPRIGGDWGECDPADPRNRRTRASILIESQTTRILVDTGPDLRTQLLAANVGHIDAVIWTHEHADHTHGIDDLRQVFHLRGSPVPGYARRETLEVLDLRFHYVFHGRGGYPPTVAARPLGNAERIGDIDVQVVDQPHGRISSSGLRFEQGGKSIGYATDFSTITDDMMRLFAGLDVLVIDALRRQPHPTHAHLDLVLEALRQLQPRQAYLTHMDQTMDYATLLAELPTDVAPGADNLVVALG